MSALFKITYGLYMLSATCDGKESGCIINTVMQQTATPETVSVTVNKQNYTTSLIEASNKCVINILDESTPFEFFKDFGMRSGRDVDKFDGVETAVVQGIKTNVNNSAGYIALEIERKIDMGTHYLFVGKIVDSKVVDGKEPVTYGYYHKNIKPKPQPQTDVNEETWVCSICNYVHKGAMPDDFVCPICKHGKADFKRVK
ncbi:MAG: flavin reductase [Eubacteriales bacterium]|nr:flavin reductase [Eubacteriales bacterium]